MIELEKQLPNEIVARSYEFNGEYAWKPDDIPVIGEIILNKQIILLGGEVWIKGKNGPIIAIDENIFCWEVKKESYEEERDFIKRSVLEMLSVPQRLKQHTEYSDRWPDVYINLTIS
jgi:hypothetical protein